MPSPTSIPTGRIARGFSLIELMIAVLLGILISIGLVTLFGATNKTNRVQDAMARMQENGRYAVSRLNADLRMATRQPMGTGGWMSGPVGTNGAVNIAIAPHVYVTSIPFPDGAVAADAAWTNTNWWALSPVNFFKGFDCSTDPCSPTVPTLIPAMGTNVGDRVKGADVLLVRYLNTEGWSNAHGEVNTVCNLPFMTKLTLSPITSGLYPSPTSNFQTDDLALLASPGYTEIFQVDVAGNTLTPKNVLGGGSVPCIPSSAPIQVSLYNFSRDFVTAIYWLKVVDDTNHPGHKITALMRTPGDNTTTVGGAQELVRGVEGMKFRYGMQYANGNVAYLTASQVNAQSTATNCAPPPIEFQTAAGNIPAANEFEAGCLWRTVKSVEADILVNSVDDMDLAPADMAYQFNGSGIDVPPTTGNMPSGLPPGKVLRREFVSLVSVRNYNP
ncbi:MAG: PilW family protein [Gemmatimonadaceae bacterium]